MFYVFRFVFVSFSFISCRFFSFILFVLLVFVYRVNIHKTSLAFSVSCNVRVRDEIRWVPRGPGIAGRPGKAQGTGADQAARRLQSAHGQDTGAPRAERDRACHGLIRYHAAGAVLREDPRLPGRLAVPGSSSERSLEPSGGPFRAPLGR